MNRKTIFTKEELAKLHAESLAALDEYIKNVKTTQYFVRMGKIREVFNSLPKAGEGEQLQVGDIFIKAWLGKPYATFTKGIVTHVDEEMVSYIPTADCAGDYGFGCIHREIKKENFQEIRILEKGKIDLLKRTLYPTMPSLKGNPGYDLMM